MQAHLLCKEDSGGNSGISPLSCLLQTQMYATGDKGGMYPLLNTSEVSMHTYLIYTLNSLKNSLFFQNNVNTFARKYFIFIFRYRSGITNGTFSFTMQTCLILFHFYLSLYQKYQHPSNVSPFFFQSYTNKNRKSKLQLKE